MTDPGVCAEARRINADAAADELARRRARQHIDRCDDCAAATAHDRRDRPVTAPRPAPVPAVSPAAGPRPRAAAPRTHPSLAALDERLAQLDVELDRAVGRVGLDGQGKDRPAGTDAAPPDDGVPPDDAVPADDAALADRITARLAGRRPAPSTTLRMILGVVAATQAALSLPWLLGVNPWTVLGHASGQHLTRDGALGIIAAVTGLVTAWRPRYAFSMLGLCAAVIAMQVLGGAVDEHADIVGGGFESIHVVTMGIVALIVAVALRRERPDGPRR